MCILNISDGKPSPHYGMGAWLDFVLLHGEDYGSSYNFVL